MLIVACGEDDASSQPVATPTATATPLPTPSPTPDPLSGVPEGSAEEILEAAFAALGDASSFHFAMDATVAIEVSGFGVQLPISFAGDFLAPDSIGGVATVSLGLATLQSEIILIGDSVYATNPATGRWEANPAPDLLIFSPLDFVGSGAPGAGDLVGHVLVGQESIDGSPTYHLRATAPPEAFEGTEGDASVEFWIGVEDGLLRRISIEADASLDDGGDGLLAEVGVSGDAALSLTIDLSDFGKPVSIEAPLPGERIENQGTDHIPFGAIHPPYNSVPATSGWHYAQPDAPAAWGVYREVLPDEVLVHNLEHGGVGVHYDCPEGCDDLVGQLSTVVQDFDKVIVSPYRGMGARVVLTAWNYIERLDGFDGERIAGFIQAHMSSPNAPEYLVP